MNVYTYLFFIYLGVLEAHADASVVIQNIYMGKEGNLLFTVLTHHSNLCGRALLVRGC